MIAGLITHADFRWGKSSMQRTKLNERAETVAVPAPDAAAAVAAGTNVETLYYLQITCLQNLLAYTNS